MNDHPPLDALDDPRVLQAVEEYQAALKSGVRPDLERYLARFPDLAEELRECLAGLHVVYAASPGFTSGEKFLAPSSLQTEPVGDFHIVRELGRGGMGIVYEAVQLSLGRRVALKVLPFAAALDPRQLQRFKNEAQTAALLHHPNIVPVHAVGCERGVHFYAMQFIEGRSLVVLLEELRAGSPSPEAPAGAPATARTAAALSTRRTGAEKESIRTIARLGILAARALDHAHQFGVVHRDIKPANLLLDQAGNLWVTDFGLALILNEVGLTRSGELLGTLRYMSPEQALSLPAVVDHRADIYSLGATLYELLTLHPLFDGRDRQELLRQIAFDEPVPPRRIDPTLPHELETIVLKAVAKTPEERYSSAGELADDLQRYLDDQPIRARRPALLERLAKWSRRHRPVVVSTVLILMLLVTGLAVSTLLIARAYDRERDRAAESRLQHERAEASFQSARAAVDMIVRIAEDELADRPFSQSIRRKMLQAAHSYYQDFLSEHSDEPTRREELTAVRTRLSGIIDDLVTLQRQQDLYMLQVREVQDILGLDDALRKKVGDLGKQLWEQQQADLRDMMTLTTRQRHGRFVERARAHEQGVVRLLTASQLPRLRQVALQQRGPTAFLDVEIGDALKLTPKQKEAMRRALDEFGPPRMPPRAGESHDAFWRRLDKDFQDRTARLLELLTESQRDRWRAMTGDPVAVPFRVPFFEPMFGPPGPGMP